MRKFAGFILLVTFQLNAAAQSGANYIQYVNPLIGTQKMGHTYPGATVPFGSVQLSPDTDEQPHNIGGEKNKEGKHYFSAVPHQKNGGKKKKRTRRLFVAVTESEDKRFFFFSNPFSGEKVRNCFFFFFPAD